MEFDELLITTGVDALVRLVKEKQRVELDEASSTLNIPSETIEDWARVLEEENILHIEYRLTRIYLTWVRPTEDEVAAETKSFYGEKKELETEIARLEEKSAAGADELAGLNKSFSDFYAKMSVKVADLDKKLAPVPTARAISEDMVAKYRDELSAMETKLQETRDAVEAAKTEISAVGVGKEKVSSRELLERIEKANAELVSLRDGMDAIRKKAAKEEGGGAEMPSVKDLRKRFEMLQADFAALRSRNAQMRQDMLSLQESTEILKSVAETIMGEEDKITALRQEMAGLSKEADRLMKNVNAVAAGVKQNADLVDRVGDSMEVAKGVLRKFPTQEKVLQELDKLRAEEQALAEKNEAVVALLEAAGGKQVTTKQLSDVLRKMEDRAAQVKRDMDSLELALEDEKNTYLTFQKIKERVVPAMEAYEQQLDSMGAKISKVREDAKGQMEGMVTEAQKLRASLKGSDIGEVMKAAEEIQEKKRMLEEIRTALEELTDLSDNINKRVTLLAREAVLLEIRTGGAEAMEGKKKELRSQLELTREEELEFRAKREELKKLIQKLWEQ